MENFIFKMELWRTALARPVPSPVAPILLLDPAPTANTQSDESAFVCGFKEFLGDVNVLTVLDMSAHKWKGGLLCDEAIRLIEKWSPLEFRYENNPGLDWFCDLLILKADIRGITLPPLHPFPPHNGKFAKENRIRNLQSLIDCDPPAIVFHEGTYCDKLFGQAQDFRIGGDRKGQENGMLDALALLAGFH